MFTFLRKRVTTEDLGIVLAYSLFRTDDSEAVSLIGPESSLSESAIKAELFCLRLFGSDMGILTSLGKDPTLAAEARAYRHVAIELFRTRDCYVDPDPREVAGRLQMYAKIHEIQTQSASNEPSIAALIELIASLAPTSEASARRVNTYAHCLEPEHVRQSLMNIGAAFATFCQAPNNPIVQMLASSVVTNEQQFVKDFVASVSVRPSS